MDKNKYKFKYLLFSMFMLFSVVQLSAQSLSGPNSVCLGATESYSATSLSGTNTRIYVQLLNSSSTQVSSSNYTVTGSGINFSANNGNQYRSGSTTSNSANFTVNYLNLTAGNYTLRVRKGNNGTWTTRSITINGRPAINTLQNIAGTKAQNEVLENISLGNAINSYRIVSVTAAGTTVTAKVNGTAATNSTYFNGNTISGLSLSHTYTSGTRTVTVTVEGNSAAAGAGCESLQRTFTVVVAAAQQMTFNSGQANVCYQGTGRYVIASTISSSTNNWYVQVKKNGNVVDNADYSVNRLGGNQNFSQNDNGIMAVPNSWQGAAGASEVTIDINFKNLEAGDYTVEVRKYYTTTPASYTVTITDAKWDTNNGGITASKTTVDNGEEFNVTLAALAGNFSKYQIKSIENRTNVSTTNSYTINGSMFLFDQDRNGYQINNLAIAHFANIAQTYRITVQAWDATCPSGTRSIDIIVNATAPTYKSGAVSDICAPMSSQTTYTFNAGSAANNTNLQLEIRKNNGVDIAQYGSDYTISRNNTNGNWQVINILGNPSELNAYITWLKGNTYTIKARRGNNGVEGTPFTVTVTDTPTWTDDFGAEYSISGSALQDIVIPGQNIGGYTITAIDNGNVTSNQTNIPQTGTSISGLILSHSEGVNQVANLTIQLNNGICNSSANKTFKVTVLPQGGQLPSNTTPPSYNGNGAATDICPNTSYSYNFSTGDYNGQFKLQVFKDGSVAENGVDYTINGGTYGSSEHSFDVSDRDPAYAVNITWLKGGEYHFLYKRGSANFKATDADPINVKYIARIADVTGVSYNPIANYTTENYTLHYANTDQYSVSVDNPNVTVRSTSGTVGNNDFTNTNLDLTFVNTAATAQTVTVTLTPENTDCGISSDIYTFDVTVQPTVLPSFVDGLLTNACSHQELEYTFDAGNVAFSGATHLLLQVYNGNNLATENYHHEVRGGLVGDNTSGYQMTIDGNNKAKAVVKFMQPNGESTYTLRITAPDITGEVDIPITLSTSPSWAIANAVTGPSAAVDANTNFTVTFAAMGDYTHFAVTEMYIAGEPTVEVNGWVNNTTRISVVPGGSDPLTSQKYPISGNNFQLSLEHKALGTQQVTISFVLYDVNGCPSALPDGRTRSFVTNAKTLLVNVNQIPQGIYLDITDDVCISAATGTTAQPVIIAEENGLANANWYFRIESGNAAGNGINTGAVLFEGATQTSNGWIMLPNNYDYNTSISGDDGVSFNLIWNNTIAEGSYRIGFINADIEPALSANVDGYFNINAVPQATIDDVISADLTTADQATVTYNFTGTLEGYMLQITDYDPLLIENLTTQDFESTPFNVSSTSLTAAGLKFRNKSCDVDPVNYEIAEVEITVKAVRKKADGVSYCEGETKTFIIPVLPPKLVLPAITVGDVCLDNYFTAPETENTAKNYSVTSTLDTDEDWFIRVVNTSNVGDDDLYNVANAVKLNIGGDTWYQIVYVSGTNGQTLNFTINWMNEQAQSVQGVQIQAVKASDIENYVAVSDFSQTAAFNLYEWSTLDAIDLPATITVASNQNAIEQALVNKYGDNLRYGYSLTLTNNDPSIITLPTPFVSGTAQTFTSSTNLSDANLAFVNSGTAAGTVSAALVLGASNSGCSSNVDTYNFTITVLPSIDPVFVLQTGTPICAGSLASLFLTRQDAMSGPLAGPWSVTYTVTEDITDGNVNTYTETPGNANEPYFTLQKEFNFSSWVEINYITINGVQYVPQNELKEYVEVLERPDATITTGFACVGTDVQIDAARIEVTPLLSATETNPDSWIVYYRFNGGTQQNSGTLTAIDETFTITGTDVLPAGTYTLLIDKIEFVYDSPIGVTCANYNADSSPLYTVDVVITDKPTGTLRAFPVAQNSSSSTVTPELASNICNGETVYFRINVDATMPQGVKWYAEVYENGVQSYQLPLTQEVRERFLDFQLDDLTVNTVVGVKIVNTESNCAGEEIKVNIDVAPVISATLAYAHPQQGNPAANYVCGDAAIDMTVTRTDVTTNNYPSDYSDWTIKYSVKVYNANTPEVLVDSYSDYYNATANPQTFALSGTIEGARYEIVLDSIYDNYLNCNEEIASTMVEVRRREIPAAEIAIIEDNDALCQDQEVTVKVVRPGTHLNWSYKYKIEGTDFNVPTTQRNVMNTNTDEFTVQVTDSGYVDFIIEYIIDNISGCNDTEVDTATVFFRHKPLITLERGKSGDICEFENDTLIVTRIDNGEKTNWSFDYTVSVNGGVHSAPITVQATDVIAKEILPALVTELDGQITTYEYEIVSVTNNLTTCENPEPGLGLTIKVNPLPMATIEYDVMSGVICENDNVDLIFTRTDDSDNTDWTAYITVHYPDATDSVFVFDNLSGPSANASFVPEYKEYNGQIYTPVKLTLDSIVNAETGCTNYIADPKPELELNIHPLPKLEVIWTPDTVCRNGSIDITISRTDSGDKTDWEFLFNHNLASTAGDHSSGATISMTSGSTTITVRPDEMLAGNMGSEFIATIKDVKNLSSNGNQCVNSDTTYTIKSFIEEPPVVASVTVNPNVICESGETVTYTINREDDGKTAWNWSFTFTILDETNDPVKTETINGIKSLSHDFNVDMNGNYGTRTIYVTEMIDDSTGCTALKSATTTPIVHVYEGPVVTIEELPHAVMSVNNADVCEDNSQVSLWFSRMDNGLASASSNAYPNWTAYVSVYRNNEPIPVENITFTASTREQGGSHTPAYIADNEPYTVYTYRLDSVALNVDPHCITRYSTPQEKTVNVHPTPTVEITASTDDTCVDGEVTFTVTRTDKGVKTDWEFEYTFSDASATASTASPVIYINGASATVTFTDVTATPDVIFTVTSVTNNATGTLACANTTPVPPYNVDIHERPTVTIAGVANGTFSHVCEEMFDGDDVIYTIARTDNAGNEAEAHANWIYKWILVDPTAPSNILNEGSETVQGTTVTLSMDFDGTTGKRELRIIELINTDYTTCTSVYSTTNPAKSNQVQFYEKSLITVNAAEDHVCLPGDRVTINYKREGSEKNNKFYIEYSIGNLPAVNTNSLTQPQGAFDIMISEHSVIHIIKLVDIETDCETEIDQDITIRMATIDVANSTQTPLQLCEGMEQDLTIVSKGTPGSTAYTWDVVMTRGSATTIGLVPNTTTPNVNFPTSFIATTDGYEGLVEANIVVTPWIAGDLNNPTAFDCEGKPYIIKVSINPEAYIDPAITIADYTICSGESTVEIPWLTNRANGNFHALTWTNLGPDFMTELTADDDVDFAAVQLVNNTDSVQHAKIEVTLIYRENFPCPTTFSFTISVNPEPKFYAGLVDSYDVCSGVDTVVVFDNPDRQVSDTSVYSRVDWKILTNTGVTATEDVSVGAYGSVNYPDYELAFTALSNVTGEAQEITIEATPYFGNSDVALAECAGTSKIITLRVNPTPTLTASVEDEYFFCETGTVNIELDGVATDYNVVIANSNIPTMRDGTYSYSKGDALNYVLENRTAEGQRADVTITPIWIDPVTSTRCEGDAVDFEVVINPIPVVDQNINTMIYCHNEEVGEFKFTGTTNSDFTRYEWERISGHGNGLAETSGINIIPEFTATNLGDQQLKVHYRVTPYYTQYGHECPGKEELFDITINPKPVLDDIAEQVYINNVRPGILEFSTSNMVTAVYEWKEITEPNSVEIGLGVYPKGVTFMPDFTPVNTTTAPIHADYRVISIYEGEGVACQDSTDFVITVLPTFDAKVVSNKEYCHNDAAKIAEIGFETDENLLDVRFEWIRIAGDAVLFADDQAATEVTYTTATPALEGYAINTSNKKKEATYKVTAVYIYKDASNREYEVKGVNPREFKVAVYPSPAINAIANVVAIDGQNVNIPAFTSPQQDVTFTWEQIAINGVKDVIGLDFTDNSKIARFDAVNKTDSTLTALIRVTAKTSQTPACEVTENFYIRVLPIPAVDEQLAVDRIHCSDVNTSTITFTGNTKNTVYNWTRLNGNLDLGSVNGVGTFTYSLNNTTGAPLTALVEVEAVYSEVIDGKSVTSSSKKQFTITVNPAIEITAIANKVVENNENVAQIDFASNLIGDGTVTYTWKATGDIIGMNPTQGSNYISGFIAANTANDTKKTTISVTADYDNAGLTCPVTGKTFDIYVLPQPAVTTDLTGLVYCSTNVEQVIPLVSNTVAGKTTYAVNKVSGDNITVTVDGASIKFTPENTGAAVTKATFTLTPSFNDQGKTVAGAPVTFTITINPVAVIDAIADKVFANGQVVTSPIAFTSNVPGAAFTWTSAGDDVGLTTSTGANYIDIFTARNTGNVNAVRTITVNASYTNEGQVCNNSTTENFDIIVLPTPAVIGFDDITVCAGDQIAVNFTASTAANTTYAWTRISGDNVGGSANGTGNINETSLTGSASVLSAVYEVIPTYTYTHDGAPYTSVGAAYRFNVTVYPKPVVNPVVIADIFCNNTEVNAGTIAFTSQTSNLEYSWERKDASTPFSGLAVSGKGQLPRFVAQNTTNSVIEATYGVTAKNIAYDGCVSDEVTFKIRIAPTPVVDVVSGVTTYHGESVTVPAFTGTADTYTWKWVQGTQIGSTLSGSASIPVFTAQNATDNAVTATYEVTPSIEGCEGTPVRFTITVNPDFNFLLAKTSYDVDYMDVQDVVVAYEIKSDNNSVILTVDFDATAEAQGFVDIQETIAPQNGSFTITVPKGVKVGVYNANVIVKQGNNEKTYPITIIVNAQILLAGTDWDGVSSYTMDCGTQTLDVVSNVAGGATISGLNSSYTFDKAGIYPINFALTLASGTVRNYTLNIEKRADFNTLVLARFSGNTLSVINNPEKTGYPEFKSYQWYRIDGNGNEIKIVGATEQYYSAGASGSSLGNDEYFVEITTVDGTIIRTCPGTIHSAGKPTVIARAYPNPLLNGEILNVNTEGGIASEIDVYSYSGVKVGSVPVTSETTQVDILRDMPSGTYILKVKGIDGVVNSEVKIIVK